MNTISFTAAAISDKGKIRGNNEDNFYFNGVHLNAENRDAGKVLFDNPKGDDLVFGVFDGMGGEALGEEASLIAAETVKKYHDKIMKHQAANCDRTFLRAVEEANAKICDKMVETGERRIGTTFAALTVQDDKAKIYNVGDSRVYLYRNKILKQISMDDTTAQRLVNMGVITKEKAKTHEDRHKLTQHLGIFKDEMVVEPHISNEIEIKKGDRFILCSDGLTDMVEDEKIAEILRTTKGSAAAQKLVDEALLNGGRDNVTVIMLEAESASVLKPAASKKNPFLIPLIIAILVVALGGIVGATQLVARSGNKTVRAKSLSWASQVSEVAVGESGSLLVQKEPAEAEGNLIWESSDTSVLTISEKGIYMGVAPGEAVVTAKLGKASCSIDITVVLPIEDIVLEESKVKLTAGKSQKIAYRIVPEGATQAVMMASADADIATVAEDGTITALREGKTTITVSAGAVSKEIAVSVATDKEEKNELDKTGEKKEDKKSTPKPSAKPADKASASPDAKPADKASASPDAKPAVTQEAGGKKEEVEAASETTAPTPSPLATAPPPTATPAIP